MADIALPTVEEVDALAPERVPAFIAQLSALTLRAATRMPYSPRSAGGALADGDGGLLSDVHEVAQLIGRSPSWVRKRGHTLPGFRQPGGRGTKVAWARRALVAWANGSG